MNWNKMLEKILKRSPGIYLHISFAACGWFLAFILIFVVICIHTVKIQINPWPSEYPMFIDGKKIIFMGREPRSIEEARMILSGFRYKVSDGEKVMVNDSEPSVSSSIASGNR
jgi:hypothetical protein